MCRHWRITHEQLSLMIDGSQVVEEAQSEEIFGTMAERLREVD
jgi:hypothetical protein